MSKNLKGRILIILAVLATSLYFAFPLQKRINLGLDLKGGMHLVLRVETQHLSANARRDAIQRAIEILRNRIDGLGVSEPVIQRQGSDEILVQLPGMTNRDAALRMIGQVAQLEFKLVNPSDTALKDALAGHVPEGYELKYTKDDHSPLLVEKKAALKGEAIKDARVDFNSGGFGEPRIDLTFSSKGAKKFAQITTNHVNERLAIILDGKVLSAPNINEPILSGHGVITGSFTFQNASLLALALRSGALPAPMHIEEERTIGPLLGKDSIESGIRAAIIGAIAVFIFMAIYYLKSGVISCIALAINLFLILGTLGLLNALMPDSQVTLTLPGIAGIILTLGMAVDSNVLINERIREELSNGRPLQAAIANGFSKAFKAIFDSNVTTLIAAFMLFQFGSGPIKGFAVTLSIGLLSSLFTALFVTRTLFMLLLETRMIKSKLTMMRFFDHANFDFISKRYFCIAFSAILITVGLVNFFHRGEKAYGIDFAGGQLQEYQFQKPVSADHLREILKKEKVADAVIQKFEKRPGDIIIRTAQNTVDSVEQGFKKYLPNNPFQVMRIEQVGPVVGKALRHQAILAIIFAMAGILVYVGFRFKHFDFATAGVIALVHDVLVTLGVLSLCGRQIDLLGVTALLTIAGYSINDTIIIYDRIRENMPKMRRAPLSQIINDSINQTLGRTVLTVAATMLVVIALYFLGGEVLNTFALALIIGFISGTYSSVYIASPLVLAWQKKKK